MTSLAPTIAAKSDQLNAEDLIAGPRDITVTKVVVKSSDDQPVWVHFEGDDRKPFKPCKTMRRLMVRVWGDDSSTYAGRSMRLYLDPEVKYGGMKVGGIRISHMSNLERAQSFYLTETRGRKKQHTVEPMPQPRRQQMPSEPDQTELSAAISALEAARNEGDLRKVWAANRALHANAAFVDAKDKRKAELAEEELVDGF